MLPNAMLPNKDPSRPGFSNGDRLHDNHLHIEKRLWYGVAAGAAAWAVQGFTSVVILSQACKTGNAKWYGLEPDSVRIVLGGVTLLLLAVALSGGVTAYRNWRLVAGHSNLLEGLANPRREFMSLIGVFASAVFSLGILWAGIPVTLVSLCANYH